MYCFKRFPFAIVIFLADLKPQLIQPSITSTPSSECSAAELKLLRAILGINCELQRRKARGQRIFRCSFGDGKNTTRGIRGVDEGEAPGSQRHKKILRERDRRTDCRRQQCGM